MGEGFELGGFWEAMGFEETEVEGWRKWRKISKDMGCFPTFVA